MTTPATAWRTGRGEAGPEASRETAWARAYVRSTLGPGAAAAAAEPLLREVFAALSREEELRDPARDRWGNWDFPRGAPERAAALHRPAVDQRLRAALGPGDAPVRWPGGAPFALCLTHDLDDVSWRFAAGRLARLAAAQARASGPVRWRARRVAGALRRAAPFARERIPDMERWFDLAAAHGFRSSLFAVAPRLPRPHALDCCYGPGDTAPWRGGRAEVGALLRELAAGGFDVGLHGSIAAASEPGVLAEERRQLEDWLGREVRSTRQHYLRWDAAATPGLQAEAGLGVDSTLGFNGGVGFRTGAAFPHRAWCWRAGAGLPLLQIPMHAMDVSLLRADTLAYGVDLAVARVAALMDAAAAVGGLLTLNWHPHAIDPAYWEAWRAILAEGARRRAWGCSAAQLEAFWSAREAGLAEAAAPRRDAG